MFAVRRLHELAQRKPIPLYACCIDLTKAYNSVDRGLLWSVPKQLRVSLTILLAIRQLHDNTRVCVQKDDGACSD